MICGSASSIRVASLTPMEEDILPWSEVPRLAKIYEDSGIEYYGTYLILQNFCRWHISYSESQILVLVPNGKIDDHGTFVIIFPQNCNIIFDTKNKDFAELEAFLKKCFEFHYKERNWFVIGPVEGRFHPMLEEVFQRDAIKKLNPTFCSAYYLTKEQALLLGSKCPDEVYVGPLKTEHAEIVDSVWPHRYNGSQDMIKMLIERNGGKGVFLKENDNLVSWALVSHYNGPGLLQTIESQKRKGYGELSAICISKCVAEKGLHPLLYILNGNTPSKNLFGKLGFKKCRRHLPSTECDMVHFVTSQVFF